VTGQGIRQDHPGCLSDLLLSDGQPGPGAISADRRGTADHWWQEVQLKSRGPRAFVADDSSGTHRARAISSHRFESIKFARPGTGTPVLSSRASGKTPESGLLELSTDKRPTSASIMTSRPTSSRSSMLAIAMPILPRSVCGYGPRFGLVPTMVPLRSLEAAGTGSEVRRGRPLLHLPPGCYPHTPCIS